MTYEQFWHGDFWLVSSYKKAYDYKLEMKEYELWKQGMYFYEAMGDISPLLHAFAKKGTKPKPYPKEPYGLKREKTEEEIGREIENERIKAKYHFMSLTKALQKRFNKKEVNDNGRNNAGSNN